MATPAASQFIYYNFLTGAGQIQDEVLTALRTTVAPQLEDIRFTDGDLAMYLPPGWTSPWAVLDFNTIANPNDVGTRTTLRREADFLRSIGYGVDLDSSGERLIVSTGIVRELYGPLPDGKEALFQFPAPATGSATTGAGVPTTIPKPKLAAMVEFLEKNVAPLFIARAQKQIEGLPETVWEGAQRRQDLRELEHLMRYLRNLIGNSASTAGNPA